MQIGSSNPLSFIGGNTPPVAGRGEDGSAPATASGSSTSAAGRPALAAGRPAPSVSVPQDSAPEAAAGVILSLQSERASTAVPADLVYSNIRKAAASQEGVLLAEPASPAEVKSQAFVHHAVAAMRAYADEQERSKALGKSANPSAGDDAALLPRSLAEVHKLAARFKLFG